MPGGLLLQRRLRGTDPRVQGDNMDLSVIEDTLDKILEHFQDQAPMDEIGVQQTASRGTQNYGFANADLTLALDNHHLIVPPTHHLEVVQFPEVLDTLEIRIGDPGRQPWNVLRDGHIAESDVPIRDLFITTAPAIPDGGTLRILAGNLRIKGTKLTNFGCMPVCDQIFEVYSGQTVQIDFSLGANAFTRPTKFSVQGRGITAGPVTLYTAIPAATPYRIYGHISYLLPSVAASQTRSLLQVTLGGTRQWSANFDGTDGDNLFPFDTGWIYSDLDNHRFNFELDNLGPAGQLIAWTTFLEIIPQL